MKGDDMEEAVGARAHEVAELPDPAELRRPRIAANSLLAWDYFLGLRILKVLIPMALSLLILYAAGKQLGGNKRPTELGPYFVVVLGLLLGMSTYIFVAELGRQYYTVGVRRLWRPLLWALIVTYCYFIGWLHGWDLNGLVLSLGGTSGVAAVLAVKLKIEGATSSRDPMRVRGQARAALLALQEAACGNTPPKADWPSVELVPVEDRDMWEEATRAYVELRTDVAPGGRAGRLMPAVWTAARRGMGTEAAVRRLLDMHRRQGEVQEYWRVSVVARVQWLRELIEE